MGVNLLTNKALKTSELMKEIALYLEGIKAGRGDLHPLGAIHLTELWKVVKDYQELEALAPNKSYARKAI